MQTLRKLFFFSVSAFLFTANSLAARPEDPPSVPGPERLSAALCELAAWNAAGEERDSLLLRKAAILSEVGEPELAYRTVGRLPMMGRSPESRAALMRLKLVYSYEAGLMDDFRSLLDEAQATGLLEVTLPSGKPRRRSEDAALILSVIPGLGNAWAGDWGNASMNFLLGTEALAIGAGAFLSGLYISAFAGGGMLLYTILPRSTDQAVKAAADFNARAIRDWYAPLYAALSAEIRR